MTRFNASSIYEAIAAEVCRLDRAEMELRLIHFDGPVKLDFTRDSLASFSTDRMRHVLAAAMWHRANQAHRRNTFQNQREATPSAAVA